jgi:DNA (cytosine-5)-methyltransferase 1
MAALASLSALNHASGKPQPERRLRSVELFAGAGGLALGLCKAGFDPAGVVENDPACKETLEGNGKEGREHTAGWEIHAEDVGKVDFSCIGQIDLLSAGAPCQPFSHGGQRRGRMDQRNLFPQVIRALHDLDPTAFLIENVRGLLFKDMDFYFKGLLRELRRPKHHYAPKPYARRGRPEDEYKVFYRLLNAADFGLPQNRMRLFIVGLKPHLAELWRWPSESHSNLALLKALLADKYWDDHELPSKVKKRVQREIAKETRKRADRYDGDASRWQTVRDLLSMLPEPAQDRTMADDASHYFVPDARLYERHTGSRLDWPAKTVKAGVNGCPGGEHIVVFDSNKHRYFTVRECALLQGFPSDYSFPWHRTKAMRQIGNAVPPPVATAVGERLAEVLNDG